MEEIEIQRHMMCDRVMLFYDVLIHTDMCEYLIPSISSFNSNIEVRYLDKDSHVNPPLLLGIHINNLEGPQQGRDKLVDF